MDIKIAIPKNEIALNLINNFENIKDRYNIILHKLDEEKCIELLKANRIDATILNPLSYGLFLTEPDIRIIPGPAYSAIGYTGLASINFKENLSQINSIAMPEKENFLITIGRLLLKEKFDIDPTVIKLNEKNEEAISKADAFITLGNSGNKSSSLDVTDEWFDAFEMPLPLAFWVCRAEEHPENIETIINELMTIKGQEEEHIHEELEDKKDYSGREGTILWKWNDEIEKSLEQCMQFLFFHQIFPAIPAVKVLGKEVVEDHEYKIKIDGCDIGFNNSSSFE
jgi:predicted solute-binding protein